MPDDGRQKQDAGEAATNRDRPDTVGRKCEYKVLGANGHLCGIVAVHRNLGNGNSWPEVRVPVSASNLGSGDRERQVTGRTQNYIKSLY